ncbi:SDR family NAD(P)-dependent oxidoreductase [Oceaniovalibus sp. ACAM 378]|uniref:SDR family NAD(P)-dependent oxidoreductase n=1 Tax=Oceaniovalibus sp. ACAM 378 TaxID=2599923 RepID=UPI002104BA5D|nr:SDR family NAD(P)-dependent oxidoreductase [Oceaniovalibus sp. ACAM 378]
MELNADFKKRVVVHSEQLDWNASPMPESGPPKVVIHNTAELVIAPFAETRLHDYRRTWGSMVQSAKFSAFASAKFALRGLTQSLAREFHPAGVHVCHTILDGIIDTARSRDLHNLDPTKMMKPDDIAQIYWELAHQTRSTWTHELDLRPASEGF